MITAIFGTRTAAETALKQLDSIGVLESQVSLIVTEQTRGNHFKIEDNTKMDKGAVAGATFGGLVGAVFASVLGAGAIAIPGLNLVVAGSLIAGLAGFGAGAATGGIVGGLIGAGIPEHEAKIYEDKLKAGNILLAVKPSNDEQADRIEQILKSSDAYDIAA